MRAVVLSVAAALLGLSAGVRADERTEGLNLEVTPYIWAVGVDGKVTIGANSANFDQSFSDLVENADAAFMGMAIVSYDRFVLYMDYDYVGLSNDGNTKGGFLVPVGTKVKGNLDLGVGTYAGGYRFNTFGQNTIDVLLGVRLTDVDETLKVPNVKFENKESLTDTVVVLRPSFRISERWRFNPTLDYGISGDSDTTYSMMPQVQYEFSDSFALRFGYKKLFYKQTSGNSNTPSYRKLDIDLSGLFIGAGWVFPAR